MGKISKYLVIYTSYIFRLLSFLIITPFLVKHLNSENWGLFLTAQSVGVWLLVLVEFGASISISKRLVIAKNSGNSHLIGKIISNTVIVKIIASLLAFAISALIVFLAKPVDGGRSIYFIAAFAAAQGLAPNWYFQAFEKLDKYALIDLIGRIIFILSVFFLAPTHNQSYFIIMLQFLSTFIISLFLFFLIVKDYSLSLPTWSGIIDILRSSYKISIFTIITSIYSNLGVFLYSLFVPAFLVPNYGNADRFAKTGLSLFAPLNQIILPRSISRFSISFSEGMKFFKRVVTIYLALGILVGASVFLFSSEIIKLFFGEKYLESTLYLKILSIIFPLTALNTTLTYHFLIPNNYETLVNKIYIFSSFSFIIFFFILVPRFTALGMSITAVVPELCALVIGGIYFYRFGTQVVNKEDINERSL